MWRLLLAALAWVAAAAAAPGRCCLPPSLLRACCGWRALPALGPAGALAKEAPEAAAGSAARDVALLLRVSVCAAL
jgi:hypothetical protein